MKKCPTCGEATEYWELRCARCAVSSDIPNDWPILLVGPSLRYRLTVFIEWLAGAAVVGTGVYLAESPLLKSLSWLFTGAILTVIQIVLFLLVVIVILGCVTAAYLGYSQLRSKAAYAVSKTKINFSDIIEDYETIVDDIAGGPPTDTRFVDREFELEKVRLTRVKQNWLAQRLSYGDIEIYIDQTVKPAIVIPGVINPHAFKEKLELILKWRASVSLQPRQGLLSKMQKP
ncbi:MAG TPA: hypothetical protein VHE58_02605 [Burkholderiales bacterium]|nr:hypothetical protein [Burkholderiales bacterium]